MSLSQKKLFLLDMDGTLYLDESLFPGTKPSVKPLWNTKTTLPPPFRPLSGV